MSMLQADEVLYESKWETTKDPVGPEWTTAGQVEVSPNGKRVYLGELGDRGALLTIRNFPPHEVIRIQCDLIVRGSWDGGRSGGGGDRVQIWLGDDRDLLDATFANRPAAQAGELSQSYPLGYQFGKEFAEKHAAAEVGSLGYTEREEDGITLTPNDAVYKLDFHVPHRSTMFQMRVRCRNYYDKYQDQNTGLDNVRVTALQREIVYPEDEWKALVAKLEGKDVVAADAALWKMMAAPKQVRAYLGGPAKAKVDTALLDRWIEEIADFDEVVRQEAAVRLQELPPSAVGKLKAAMIVHDDPEVAARIEQVIATVSASGEEVGVLEHFKNRMRGLLFLPHK